MRFLRLALLTALTGLFNIMPLTAQAATTQQPFSAVYTVSSKGLDVATMTRELTLTEDGNYVFTSTLDATGIAAVIKRVHLQERSQGVLRDHHFQPKHYEITRSSGKKHHQSKVEFDWQRKLAVGTTDAKTWETPLTAEVLDKLVYQLALMEDLRRQRKDLLYRVVDDGKLQRYGLTLLGKENLAFGDTPIATIKVEYRRNDTRRTTLWCAPQFDFLPVQIEYREKDGTTTLARLQLAP